EGRRDGCPGVARRPAMGGLSLFRDIGQRSADQRAPPVPVIPLGVGAPRPWPTRRLGDVRVSVCPSAVVDAPPERVWGLLTRPEGFDVWTDATLVAAEPEGPARAGQRLRLETSALGRHWAVTIDVLDVDPERRLLHFRVDLPFGLV